MKHKKPPPPPSSSLTAAAAAQQQQPAVRYPELDLHGLRKEEAMRAVTDFLESEKVKHQRNKNNKQHQQNRHHNFNKAMVRIITGTGSHSHAGPVLRSAVESLLTRRHMEFERDTPGSFVVNAASGETWYSTDHNQQSVYSKVVMTQHQDYDPLIRLQKLNQQPRQGRRNKSFSGNARFGRHGSDSSCAAASTASSSASSSSSNGAPLADLLSGPTVAQVMHHEKTVERVKEESRRSVREHDKRNKAAANDDLQQALSDSVVQLQKEQQKQEDEFASLMAETLKAFEQEAAQQECEEEAMLRRALQESSQLQQQQQQQDGHAAALPNQLSSEEWEAATQQALAMSLREHEQQP